MSYVIILVLALLIVGLILWMSRREEREMDARFANMASQKIVQQARTHWDSMTMEFRRRVLQEARDRGYGVEDAWAADGTGQSIEFPILLIMTSIAMAMRAEAYGTAPSEKAEAAQ